MFKKLCLALVLVLMVTVGGALATEDGKECTLKSGEKVMQVMPGNVLKGVITPNELTINIGPALTEGMVSSFNAMPMNQGMDWTGGNIAQFMYDFGNGPVPIMIVVRDSSLKDCK